MPHHKKPCCWGLLFKRSGNKDFRFIRALRWVLPLEPRSVICFHGLALLEWQQPQVLNFQEKAGLGARNLLSSGSFPAAWVPCTISTKHPPKLTSKHPTKGKDLPPKPSPKKLLGRLAFTAPPSTVLCASRPGSLAPLLRSTLSGSGKLDPKELVESSLCRKQGLP